MIAAYATYMLEQFDVVRQQNLDGRKMSDELVKFVKERVALEEAYAKALAKLSTSYVGSLEFGTLNTAFEFLRGDVANSSEQHRLFAENLREEVLPSVEQPREEVDSSDALMADARHVIKDRRFVRDKYLKAVSKYKRLRSAAEEAARAARLPAPAMEQSQDALQLAQELLEQEAELEMTRGRSGSVTEALTAGLGAMGRRPTMQLSSAPFVDGFKSMFGGSGSKQEGLRRAAETAVSASAAAYRDVVELEGQYREVDARHKSVVSTALEHLQEVEMKRRDRMRSGLRTMTVFRSALLANIQYDQQKLSQELEAVDATIDIGEFIACYSRRVHGSRKPPPVPERKIVPLSHAPATIEEEKGDGDEATSGVAPAASTNGAGGAGAGAGAGAASAGSEGGDGSGATGSSAGAGSSPGLSAAAFVARGAARATSKEEQRRREKEEREKQLEQPSEIGDLVHLLFRGRAVRRVRPRTRLPSVSRERRLSSASVASGASANPGTPASGTEVGDDSHGSGDDASPVVTPAPEAGSAEAADDDASAGTEDGGGAEAGAGAGAEGGAAVSAGPAVDVGSGSGDAGVETGAGSSASDGEPDAEAGVGDDGDGGVGEGGTEVEAGAADAPDASPATAAAPPSRAHVPPRPPRRHVLTMQDVAEVRELGFVPSVFVDRVRRMLRANDLHVHQFVRAMDVQRGQSWTLCKSAFDALLSLMLVALDIADEQDDYTAAKSIMVMSQTFYINTPEPSTGTESGATGPATHSRASSAASAGSDGASASAGTASPGDGTRSSASGGESPAGADSNADDDNYAIGDDDDADSGFHGAGSVPTPTAESRRDASDPRTADLAPVSTAAEEAEEVRDPEYFQRHLKRHRVWQNMRFWESAVFEGIGSEMAKINTANQQELHMRETDITMGQLAFYAFNMIGFGLPMSYVQALMDKYAQFVKMDDAQWQYLVGEVARLSKERDEAEASGAVSPVR